MGEINELRQRVEAAEERFGLIKEQQSKYSQRLIDLIARLENDLQTLRHNSESNEEEITRLNFQNEELRSMLHSLLLSIESDNFDSTLRSLDTRIAAMIQDASATAESDEGPASPEAEDALQDAAADNIQDMEESAQIHTESGQFATEPPDLEADTAPHDLEIDIPDVGSAAMESTDFGDEAGAIEESVNVAAEEDFGIADEEESGEEAASAIAEDFSGEAEQEIAPAPQEDAGVEMIAQSEEAVAEEPEAADDEEPVLEESAPGAIATLEENAPEEIEPVPGDAMVAKASAEDTPSNEDESALDILFDAPAEPGEKEEPSVKDIIKRVSALVRDLAEDDTSKDAEDDTLEEEIAADANNLPVSNGEGTEIPAESLAASSDQGDILNLIDDGEEEQASLAAS